MQQGVSFLAPVRAESASELGLDELRQGARLRQGVEPGGFLRGQGRGRMPLAAEQGGDLRARQLVIRRQGGQHRLAPPLPAAAAQAGVDAVADRAPVLGAGVTIGRAPGLEGLIGGLAGRRNPVEQFDGGRKARRRRHEFGW